MRAAGCVLAQVPPSSKVWRKQRRGKEHKRAAWEAWKPLQTRWTLCLECAANTRPRNTKHSYNHIKAECYKSSHFGSDRQWICRILRYSWELSSKHDSPLPVQWKRKGLDGYKFIKETRGKKHTPEAKCWVSSLLDTGGVPFCSEVMLYLLGKKNLRMLTSMTETMFKARFSHTRAPNGS